MRYIPNMDQQKVRSVFYYKARCHKDDVVHSAHYIHPYSPVNESEQYLRAQYLSVQSPHCYNMKLKCGGKNPKWNCLIHIINKL